jgi:serine/threonine protein kinase
MLRDEYGEKAPLPQDQSLYYLQQILEGVNFLHQSGYLHLDIKCNELHLCECVCTCHTCVHACITCIIILCASVHPEL